MCLKSGAKLKPLVCNEFTQGVCARQKNVILCKIMILNILHKFIFYNIFYLAIYS